ncbi:sulfatase-like hydrolase/transferase [Halosimplex rubrum]|uniref:Sulfatase-like hydrolase/transferase n=1 Tax=Halosimplex rubrum TaxID=869889 RepID=A0A7D5T4E2_9EURY|nr:sulfatase-like hydrolase/transferase [Halosimplex rubrum]QLH76833.1 sulfatase-like hydrolase/transferase [Halosimplex rubrum]
MARVAVVVLDTVRKDAFDEHFDWLPGVHFQRAWSPSHRTPPVHASLFCGDYPSSLGVYSNSDALDTGRETIAEALGATGYETVGFSANPYISPSFGYDRGFDRFHLSSDLATLRDDIFDWGAFVERTDDEGVSKYLRAVAACLRSDSRSLESLRVGLDMWLDGRITSNSRGDGASEVLSLVRSLNDRDDRFLFVNLMEAHEPYVAPSEYRSVDLGEFPSTVEASLTAESFDPERIRSCYDDCVEYLSDVYRPIFSELRTKFDHVITCADHGELFAERGLWGHFYGLDPELTNVPLVVWSGERGTETSTDTVSLLDIHATVAEMAGVSTETAGRDLRTLSPDDPTFTECHGVAQDRLERLETGDRMTDISKPLCGVAAPPGYYGYDTVDGFEERGSTTVENLSERLDRHRARLPRAGGETDRVPSGAESHLEDLGYL